MSNSTIMPGVDKKEWDQAVGKAKEVAASAGEMAGYATNAVGAMASRAACDIGKEADHLTASAGTCIEGLGDRLSKNAPHSGILGNTSQAVAGAVREGGEYLQSAKLSGMTEDVAHLVRRNPIPAILIAIGLGWFVGRNLKT
jgi:hypothetical protein